MITNMIVAVLIGMVLLVFFYFLFSGKIAGHKAAIKAEIDELVTAKLRQAQELAAEFVRNLAAGAPPDQLLADHQRRLAGLFPCSDPDRPWNWRKDDVDAWRKNEEKRRVEEANRRLLLPAVGSFLLVITLTAVIVAVCYQFLASNVASNATTPTALPAPAALPTGDGSTTENGVAAPPGKVTGSTPIPPEERP